jgi:hypothetical protein
MLIAHPKGDYRFLPGSEPYSSGVIAQPGFEIVHAALLRPPPWREGFLRIERHLRAAGRGREALCAVELRSPAPFTREGFLQFNQGYRAMLEEWGLLVDGRNPVARTNVAPQGNPPSEPALFAFSYTVQAGPDPRPTFIVAGGGELRGGPLLEAPVVRPGETSPEAMREKASYVMRAMSRRLEGLAVSWEDVTTTDIYTVQPLESFIGPVVLDAIGSAAGRGLCLYHARPPLAELEYEMDARGVRTELYL